MQNKSRSAKWLLPFALSLIAIGALIGCQNSDTLAPTSAASFQNSTSSHIRTIDPSALTRAIEVQNRHSNELMRINGVNGTGIGVGEEGNPIIYIFTTRNNVSGIPSTLEGIRTHIENVAEVTAFNGVYTGVYRGPMPSGVSVGNDKECAAGSIACVVTDAGKINRYLLSNNHVFARLNRAAIGERIDQPGRFDNQCAQTGQVASLSRYIPINFSRRGFNIVDCAIAKISGAPGQTSASIAGYAPTTVTEAARIGLEVKKTGRLTGLTSGKISAINVTINVNYGWGHMSKFINQIYIGTHAFSGPGDSGALIVDDSGTGNENNPVGLLFAGSGYGTFANPIQSVFALLGVTIVTDILY